MKKLKNKQIKIPKTKFDDNELNKIINKNYCPGCKTISKDILEINILGVNYQEK